MMAIQQQEYIDLKEYWDFQRKKEYLQWQINLKAEHLLNLVLSM